MSSKASDAAESLLHPDSSNTPVRTEIFAAFAAIAWYNAIELIILCFVSFKRRRGCYFWSLLVASSSIVPHCLGYVLLFFPTGVSPYICVTLIVFSWYGMVTGQSLVLWSRLHLVLQNTKILWGVLWMIMVDAVLLHIPTTVLLYGTVAAPVSAWSRGYSTMEHIQLVGFCIQELIISGLYVWETVKLLRLRPQGRPHGILHQLLTINIIILLLDVAIVVIEYVGYYAVQVMFKPVAYSIKLKLEYAILGKLVAIAQGAQTYNDDELPSSTREINSFPSSHETPPRPDFGRHPRRMYSFPWFWENSHQSSCTSSGI
ncbi:uncharacterized protein N7496_002054 [Penicillium cataractarum]|uniref:DUF7703 domain-containing protein n=1 Tax=Penicillium cataractarum TaxID=2100454 RepID=A0A9W9VX51_9EURO|nr:uncharacterized protein N7496_002054 [Penicillium cataractarum]KAJ5390986.1 hypothetical protein N7496_002054 [Penicillium cataractarum]